MNLRVNRWPTHISARGTPRLETYPCIPVHLVDAICDRKEGTVFTQDVAIIRVVQEARQSDLRVYIVAAWTHPVSGLHQKPTLIDRSTRKAVATCWKLVNSVR